MRDTPWIIAHRGASFDAPENTLAAFALAWERGADGVECDVRLTADRRLVCLHDEDTGRTGDGGGDPGAGLAAAQQTLAALQRVDVGRWKAARFAGQTAPTLDAVLAVVPAGKRIFIEVKSGVDAVPALLAALDESGLDDVQVVVISFDAAVVRAVKQRRPALTVNWLTGFERDSATGRWSPEIGDVLRTLAEAGADGVGCRFVPEHVDDGFADRLRAAGYGFHVWTINDPDDAAQAVRLGADSITTDRPGYLRERFGRGSGADTP